MFNILCEESDDNTWFLEEYAVTPMNAAGDCMAAISDEISASTFMPIIVRKYLILCTFRIYYVFQTIGNFRV